MQDLKKSLNKMAKKPVDTVTAVVAVVLGTEMFHLINSFKLNLVMPTLSNLLKESTVRSWSVGNNTFCVRYGNFLWDGLSVVVFVTIVYLLWKFIIRKIVK